MMRCFLPCFAASKRRKHSANAIPTERGQTHVADGALEVTNQLIQQKAVEEAIDFIAASKIKIKEQSNNSGETTQTKELIKNGSEGRFDDALIEVDLDGEKRGKTEEDLQDESSESLFSLSIDSRKQVSAAEEAETEVNSPLRLKGSVCARTFGSTQHASSVLNPFENETKENTNSQIVKFAEQLSWISKRKENTNEESSAEELINKLEGTKEHGKTRPLNHLNYRYRDCSDEGHEDISVDENFDVTFADDDPQSDKRRAEGEEGSDVKGTWVQEESSESLFSLSTDSRKRISAADKAEDEVDSLSTFNITEEETPGTNLHVLNPIENLTQGRVIKTKIMQPQNKEKENINLVQNVDIIPFGPEPGLKVSNHRAKQKFSNDKKQETRVDTSLSSWLVEPETTPIATHSANSVGDHTPKGGRGSPMSHEDRPILGALTIEELRKYSASESSRRSRSKSPDETPIIGTVGSYWSHTGQTMESDLSKSTKDAKRKWNSTTLKARLETAFEASFVDV